MLVELGASTENYGLYWNSNRVDGNMKDLSDRLTEKLYNKRNDLNEEFENIKQLLCFWYEISGKTKELDVIKKLQKIAETSNQDIHSQVIALCSFIDPNMVIRIGEDIFQNTDELVNFSNKIKLDKRQYFDWLLNNQKDITRYTGCVIPTIKQITENLLQDLMPELNRRKEEQERRQREEQERRQREEQERKQREIQIFGMEISDIKVGSFITYGRYFQDSDNAKSPIEWLVLDVKGNEALLISRYGLDCKQYHHEKENITWKDCDLRKWLNRDFLKSAFSNEESERILVSKLKNDNNPKYYGTTGGNDTKDRIFCLSIAEAEQYFSSKEDRQCRPTAYAREHGIYYVKNDCCYWWLRSPGYSQYHATNVYTYGALYLSGDYVDSAYSAVRPALRIICNL